MENAYTLLLEGPAGLHCQIGIGSRMPTKGLSFATAAERAPIGSAKGGELVDESLRMSFHTTQKTHVCYRFLFRESISS